MNMLIFTRLMTIDAWPFHVLSGVAVLVLYFIIDRSTSRS